MAEIVLFHHAMGPTEGTAAIAKRLEAAGHAVHSPDLFDGQRFDTIEDGVAHLESIGFGTIVERGRAAVEGLPDGLVYVGVSLGVIPAMQLAQTRPGARGAVLLESCLPATEFGDGWPIGVPVQIHGMTDDPFFAGEGDVDNARAIVESVGDDIATLFQYPGDRHLFVDASLPSHDPDATVIVMRRMVEFVARIDDGAGGA